MASAADTANYQLLTITKNGKEISLEGKTTSFDYYESLLSPNITAVITFIDSGGSIEYNKEYDSQERLGTIYNSLPITGTGDEEIRFKISSALGTLDFSERPLYVNGSINPDQQSQRESVILSLVSKSAIKNQETHVKKNYSSSPSNDVSVKLIAENILNLDRLEIEKTANKYPFIGNMKSPFDVIIMLAAKSKPEGGNPGFFFYETQNGHNFKSIDKLIDKGPVAEYFKTDVNQSSINTNNDFKISSFSVNKNQNLINALKSGVYSSRVIQFNPKTFKEEEKTITFGTIDSALGKNEVPTPEKDDKDDRYNRILYSIKDVGALSRNAKEGGSAGNPTDWQGNVEMRYNLLFTQMCKIQVPCNPNLKAGDVIKCNIEAIFDTKELGSADPVESGNYLILDLCHHYDTKNSFTSMTLVRDTYGLYTNKN